MKPNPAKPKRRARWYHIRFRTTCKAERADGLPRHIRKDVGLPLDDAPPPNWNAPRWWL